MSKPTEARESEIGDIQEALKRLDSAASIFRDNLIPVLKDNLETETEDAEVLVPLATDFPLLYRSITNILVIIQHLNNACELFHKELTRRQND